MAGLFSGEKDDQIFERIHEIIERKDDQILEGSMMGFLKERCTRFLKRGCTRFLNGDAPDFGEEQTQILIRIKVQLHHWEDDHQPAAPFVIHFQRALKRGKEN